MNEWISIEDEMPDDNGLYWISYAFGTSEAYFDNGDFLVRGILAKFPKVTHWMPLPEPPEAK